MQLHGLKRNTHYIHKMEGLIDPTPVYVTVTGPAETNRDGTRVTIRFPDGSQSIAHVADLYRPASN